MIILANEVQISPRTSNLVVVDIDEETVKDALADIGYFVFNQEELDAYVKEQV